MRLCQSAAPVYRLLDQSQEEWISSAVSNSSRKCRSSISVNRRRTVFFTLIVLLLFFVTYNFVTSENYLHRVIYIYLL
jgi:hypothetical protein